MSPKTSGFKKKIIDKAGVPRILENTFRPMVPKNFRGRQFLMFVSILPCLLQTVLACIGIIPLEKMLTIRCHLQKNRLITRVRIITQVKAPTKNKKLQFLLYFGEVTCFQYRTFTIKELRVRYLLLGSAFWSLLNTFAHSYQQLRLDVKSVSATQDLLHVFAGQKQ